MVAFAYASADSSSAGVQSSLHLVHSQVHSHLGHSCGVSYKAYDDGAPWVVAWKPSDILREPRQVHGAPSVALHDCLDPPPYFEAMMNVPRKNPLPISDVL